MFLKQPTEDLVQKRLAPPSGLYNMFMRKTKKTVNHLFYRCTDPTSSELKGRTTTVRKLAPPRPGGYI